MNKKQAIMKAQELNIDFGQKMLILQRKSRITDRDAEKEPFHFVAWTEPLAG